MELLHFHFVASNEIRSYKARETYTCLCPVLMSGVACYDPESFVKRGLNLITFYCFFFFFVFVFLVDEGIEDPNNTINGPSLAFCWSVDDGSTLNAGLVALQFYRGSRPVVLRNPIFCDFSGGGGGPDPLSPPAPLDTSMSGSMRS